MMHDVIIIGGGLGGLQCGYILCKKGYDVCVIEKEKKAGGCLQTFRRGKNVFDTGFHYVGGLDEGQPLRRLMDYFGLSTLPWHRLDANGYDEVIINDKSFLLASGHGRFVETLSSHFPKQRAELEEYASFLKNVGDNIFHVFGNKEHREENFFKSLFSRSAYAYLKETIKNPLLINVLSGNSLKLELHPDRLPLYIFAQTNESYTESAWRLKGGGSLIVESLSDAIQKMGGTVMTNREVTMLKNSKEKINSVLLDNDEERGAKIFISDIHPASTIDLLQNKELVRSSFRNRISRLENTYGIFTAHLELKENRLPYLNRNVHIHNCDDVWSYHHYPDNGQKQYVFVSFAVPENGSPYATHIDLLSPMHWEELREWEHTTVGKRGQGYLDFKAKRADDCIDIASGHIPRLRESIETVYTSTPLTWRDYTGTVEGSAYGIRKNYNELPYTILTPKTPVPNLFLTGQNLSVHGVLGVSMTSFFTCAEIIGADTVLKLFR
jgi:all-trans-retinol 13,14-reductase